MGYNTPILILNDALDFLRDDPEVGKKLASAIQHASCNRKRIDVPLQNGRGGMFCNPVTVLPPQHADVTRVLVVGQNHIREIGAGQVYFPNDDLGILKSLADHLGYTVSKKRTKA